jgi:hypothetical protein
MLAEMLSNPLGAITQAPAIPAQMFLNSQILTRLLADGARSRAIAGPVVKGGAYLTAPIANGRGGLLADESQNYLWK